MLDSEDKAAVGLSWQPKLALFSSTKREKSQADEGALYTPVSQLVDGLFLPPNDPRKLNKLSRKQVKDTAGKNWFDMPAQTITPELKKDLQLLKIIQELGEEYLHGKCLRRNLDRKSVVLGSRTGSDHFLSRGTRISAKIILF